MHYRALLDQHINPTIGAVPLGRLSAPGVRSWYASTLVDKPTSGVCPAAVNTSKRLRPWHASGFETNFRRIYGAAGQHSSSRESWAQALELLGNIRRPAADRIRAVLRTGQPGSSAEST